MKVEALFFDVETTPVRHDERLPTPVVASFAVGSGEVRLCDPAEMAKLVRSHAGPVVGHNVAFDLAVLDVGLPARLYDTAIRATLQGARDGDPAAADSSLKRLAAKVGIELSGKGTTQLSFRPGVPLTPTQEAYAREDVVATRAVWNQQGGAIRLPDEERQTQFSTHIFQMAREGLRVDLPRVQRAVAGFDERIAHLRAELRDLGLIQPRGPKSNPWKREAVSVEHVQALLKRSGAQRFASPDSDLLASDEEALIATGLPELKRLVEYRAVLKERAMWAAFDTGEGDVVRARWKPLVVTGRVACSSPNLTNIPREGGLRETLLPPEGEVFIDADFPALELRTWAYVCRRWLGRSTLLETWAQGRDPHWVTAAAILRMDYQRAQAHPRGKESRQLAKVLNFGLPGGMYPKRLRDHLRSKGFPVGLYAATSLRNSWLKAIPEAKDYFAAIEGMKEGEKYRVALPDSGRERLCFINDAKNYPFQGLGSDVAKEALVRCQAAGVKVRALVHDQILASCRLQDAEECGRAVTACMQAAGEAVCPGVPWEGISFAIYPERWVSK